MISSALPGYPGPSAWSHRVPAMVLAAAGFAIATYLALFQLGRVGAVWEPLFGDGSRRVLTSPLASVLPIPDAAIGAAGYAVEILLLLAGGRARWCRRPWLVLVGALVVAAMAAGGIVLLVVQVAVIEDLCTLCLVSAALSIGIAVLAAPEAAAALRRVRDEGWRARAANRPRSGDRTSPQARSAVARIHDQHR